jgi:hypothetical protein
MNDAYAAMTLGAKHPWEVWADIWNDIGPHGGVPDPGTHLLPNPFT